jgi:hypothetical protein
LNYIKANFPNLIDGTFIYDWELNETNALAEMPGTTAYDWNVIGKPAQQAITAAYGGQDFIKPFDASFPGSVANDQICLYGNAISVHAGAPVTQPQTFATYVSVTIGGNIINGQTQTVHFYVNGTDEGAHTLQLTAFPTVDAQGITHTGPQTFTFALDGLVNINSLKVALDGPVNIGGVENSQTFISFVTVDGVSLTQGTYFPLQGPSQQLTLTAGGQSDGGYELIDASPWNSQLASRQIGTAADPIQVNGGGGTDTVHVLGLPSEYTINGIGTTTVILSEHSGLDQNAVLTNISYVAFQDGSVLALANGTWSAGSQPLIAAPAVAVEGSMYSAVGSSAEINNLMVNFLPPQETNATKYGLNALVYGCEVLGLAFAFGNENGGQGFDNSFGPANATMPATGTGDAAFAAAASSTIFGSAANAGTPSAILGFVSNWKAFYTQNGVPGVVNATADQIDLAARGAAWGDAVGVALANNLGPLSTEVNNFLNDVFAGTAIYSAPLTSQPIATTSSVVSMLGMSPPSDSHLM